MDESLFPYVSAVEEVFGEGGSITTRISAAAEEFRKQNEERRRNTTRLKTRRCSKNKPLTGRWDVGRVLEDLHELVSGLCLQAHEPLVIKQQRDRRERQKSTEAEKRRRDTQPRHHWKVEAHLELVSTSEVLHGIFGKHIRF